MAWLARSVCSAEAEKARLATRGHLGQPGLCFNAWPQSTWRRKEKRANGGEGWKQWRQEESVTQGGAKLRKPASPWLWCRLCLWAGAISIIYLTALKRSKAFKAELQKVWADRGEIAVGEKGLTKWWQAVSLACLRESRVYSGLGQRRKGHLTGVWCHRWAERGRNQSLLWWGRMMRKINIYGFPQSKWIVNIIYDMLWTHLLPW